MDSKMPPGRLQDGQDGQDGFQDGSKMSPRRPRWPQESPRRPKRPQRGLQEVLQEGSKRPNSLIFLGCLIDFGFSSLWVFRQPKTAQGAPKIVQEASKMAPERPKKLPGQSPKGSKTAKMGLQDCQDAPKRAQRGLHNSLPPPA